MDASVPTTSRWCLANGRWVSLNTPVLMGIVNVTPDSFADGGRFERLEAALAHATGLVNDGAAILDIGGESTRPGAARVGEAEQIARVVPLIEAIRGGKAEAGEIRAVPISVDTTLPGVARACLDAGADAINDVSGGDESLRDGRSEMHEIAARYGAGLVLMHRLRPPGADSYSDRYAHAPEYGDVMGEVCAVLARLTEDARRAGVARESIVIDPGLGFGKSVEDNLRLIRRTDELGALGMPVMSALSRKSFVGRVGLWRESQPEERLAATLALSRTHAERGARLLRVHDVREHAAMLAGCWPRVRVSPDSG